MYVILFPCALPAFVFTALHEIQCAHSGAHIAAAFPITGAKRYLQHIGFQECNI